VDNLLISQTLLELTMFKHHFTVYFALKTFICLAGYLYGVAVLGVESSTLLIVAALSLAFTPVMAWLEAQQ
jgi:hypothetical protein